MEKVNRVNFNRFPYRREVRENGDINNGGFDLILFPEKINDIHEITEYPWFKDFIQRVNSKTGIFMTMGCAIGYEGDVLYGYIDFTCRPEAIDAIKEDLITLDNQYHAYLSQAMPDEETRQRAIEYVQHILLWLASPLEIYGESYSQINVTFREREQDGLKWAFDHLAYFLTEYYPAKYMPAE
ncbi:hypothetical protein ACP26F_14470 [Franconibacter pulveris 1160]|uniref:hypothetical protein n=1 Tax=Franconibacter pulveris TaxID=435910 RepID=UPI00046531BB|nr:hypothetical protein [Franconibacter pulveris]EGO8461992.1 hypothetical protein [Escherichia coli]